MTEQEATERARELVSNWRWLMNNPQRGNNTAYLHTKQAILEEAIFLLAEQDVPAIFPALFSELLGGVFEKWTLRSSKESAEWTVALWEAKGAKPAELARVYAHMRGFDGGDDRKTVRDLRKRDDYKALVESFRRERGKQT